MRAWRVHQLGEPEKVLQLEEIEPPLPGPGQVQLRVETVGASFAENLLIRGLYQVQPDLPMTPGSEIAGHVSAVGDGATFRVGDRAVAVNASPAGGFADFCVAAEEVTFPIPDDIPSEIASALIGSYTTAYFSLYTRAQLEAGECVLIHAAAGAVGSACIQLAKAAGAKVIATAGGAEKVAFCGELGADIAIDYLKDDFVDAVKEATNGRGADVVCDNVGGDVFDRSTKCIAPDGRILVIGFASGRIPEIAVNRLLLKNCAVVGVNPAQHSWEEFGERFAALCELYRSGAIAPPISFVSFDEVPDVFRRIATRDSRGKFLVQLHA